ncbi:MAG: 50S ribosomal protein L23 [Candidatus Gracilibacteria bacterium]
MIDISVLSTPLVTEKTSANMEKGVYTFLVRKDTNKIEVKQAFEAIFGEKVATVRMTQVLRKARPLAKGNEMEKRQAQKKAIITLKGDKKVDIFQTKAVASAKKEAKK